MKKSLIAAGAASVALAAMPIVGVFADEVVEQGIVKDNVTVNVNSTCSVTSAGTLNTNTISRSVDFGTMATATSRESNSADMSTAPVAFTINCNGAWHVTAEGAGAANHTQDLYKAAGTGADTSPEGVITGAAPSGDVSYWQFKVAGTNTSSTYNTDYVAIPASAVTVASSASGVSGDTITPAYKITLAGNQTPGIYSGAVAYTLATGEN